jgi:SAM-dependent methyltransferase
MNNPYLENNRQLWEHWTRLHLETETEYQAALAALKSGGTTLDEVKIAEVGDVRGKSMLHLQCHFGLDSLSWARQGALVTGVDFSEESIQYARALSAELDVPARFICEDIYRLPDVLEGQFDVIYTAEGVLTWLPDLAGWAGLIARYLKPGGIFYIKEYHPFRRVVFPHRVDAAGRSIQYRYFSGEPVRIEERGSYAQPEADTVDTAYYWVHSLGKIVTALCAAGLRLEFLHEFPKVYASFPTYQETDPGQFEMTVLKDWAIPNMFSLRATH